MSAPAARMTHLHLTITGTYGWGTADAYRETPPEIGDEICTSGGRWVVIQSLTETDNPARLSGWATAVEREYDE